MTKKSVGTRTQNSWLTGPDNITVTCKYSDANVALDVVNNVSWPWGVLSVCMKYMWYRLDPNCGLHLFRVKEKHSYSPSGWMESHGPMWCILCCLHVKGPFSERCTMCGSAEFPGTYLLAVVNSFQITWQSQAYLFSGVSVVVRPRSSFFVTFANSNLQVSFHSQDKDLWLLLLRLNKQMRSSANICLSWKSPRDNLWPMKVSGLPVGRSCCLFHALCSFQIIPYYEWFGFDPATMNLRANTQLQYGKRKHFTFLSYSFLTHD